ncbi:MAG: ubiquinone/menaquinone biosynthesis methyltransferase [Ardenticatenia bacterium]|nr:ubiquinone/menaquinone biosynthesis methyltransferase [Ardenticatenia bacterium]
MAHRLASPTPARGQAHLPAWRLALQGEQKAAYVRTMFGRIARRYDLMNRLMSLGRDQAWRRLAAREAHIIPGALVLDLATGTGDLAFAVLELEPTAHVVGADFAMPMLVEGARKHAARGQGHLALLAADALQLPFAEATFDAVLSAFLMRNVADLRRGFAEQHRVLRPGGRVVCLEITSPPWPGLRALFDVYFGWVVPALGGLVAGDPDAYTYLPASVRRFPRPDALAGLMEAVGFREVAYRRLALGAIAVHVGVK